MASSALTARSRCSEWIARYARGCRRAWLAGGCDQDRVGHRTATGVEAGTESLQTPRWRKPDSNPRSPLTSGASEASNYRAMVNLKSLVGPPCRAVDRPTGDRADPRSMELRQTSPNTGACAHRARPWPLHTLLSRSATIVRAVLPRQLRRVSAHQSLPPRSGQRRGAERTRTRREYR
jgi:hypothetical protein